MDAAEALAVVAAGVVGWALGRRRGDANGDRERSQASREPLSERVERSGRDVARHMGTAVAAGGVRAVAYTAKGVTEAGNAVAMGAGRTAGAVDSARSGVTALLHRTKPGETDQTTTSGGEAPARAGATPSYASPANADRESDSGASEAAPGSAPASA
jgi:hypothetical protein